MSVREGSGLDLDPQEELGAVGDGSHIAMVTSGTDAEHAMDYQRGGPSVRGVGEARVTNPEPPTPGPSISASPTENASMVLVHTDVHRTEVVRLYPLPTLDTCERIREMVRVAADVRRL